MQTPHSHLALSRMPVDFRPRLLRGRMVSRRRLLQDKGRFLPRGTRSFRIGMWPLEARVD